MSDLNTDQRATAVRIEPQVVSKDHGKLTQRAYLNGVAAILDYGAQMAVALAISPILVAELGSTLFGILQILQRLTTYLSVADGRPTQALKWAIANQQHSDDHIAKQRSIGSALGVWLIFLPILATAGTILVWFSPMMTKVSAGLSPLVRVASALLVTDLILFGIATLPESVLRGMNLGYKRMVLTPVLTIARGVLTVGVIYLGFGLVGVAAALPITSVVAGILYWGTIRWYIPWFGIMRPTMAEIRRFLSFSGWFFAWTLINKILLASDVVVLGIVATAELVTVYTLTGYAAQTVLGIMSITIGAAIPGLGGLIGGKQYDESAVVRGEMMTATWLLTTAIGVTILLWNRSFVNLWVGMAHYAGPLANLLIVLAVTQLSFIRNDAFIIDLTLDLSRKVILGSLSALLSIGFAAILIRPLGIAGLCLGLIAGRSILTVSYPLLVGSALDISPRVRLISLIRPGIVMGLAFGLSSYLGQRLFADGWIEFIVCAGLSCILAVCVGFVSGLTRGQKRAMMHRFSQVQLFGRA